ncbi:MAG: transglutaminase, partial [Frankiales bacterium]|nr:transglutaminase [Frankiales bacterium]
GLFAGEGHIPLAATPHPYDAAPITGTSSAAEAVMDFSNTVRRITDRPRATRPYSREQWQQILLLGQAVEEQLAADDVRLTMGGEPTFVSAADTTSAQWNTDADGEEKRAKALELAAKLKAHYAPQGLLQHSQGKWYPGEPLPRWQIAINWLADGEALWSRPDLLDDPWSPPSHDAADSSDLAARLMAEIAAGIGVEPDFAQPAYEDLLARLVDEAQLPVGDPPAADVSEPGAVDARAELVAALDAEAGEPVGWVLPLHRSEDGKRWSTTRWRTRRGRIVLIGGTSPLGMRLPLRSITWSPAPGRPEASLFAPPAPLPRLSGDGEVTPADVVSVEEAPTTAVTVQARDGHLFVFLPPLTELAASMELLHVVQAAAAAVGVPVVIEGYPVASDARLRTLTVTPDPGVIEVNVQPASSWSELVEISETLNGAAAECGLATEKFAFDGTHTGTGGGSHLTLGGAKPADSPLLRRPDLLVSLLNFWQNHPSLSYLFSGRFIGPTSQAPRVDEARHESLYELEIAFAELDRLAADGVDAVHPWTVDRALRHLLTDITGNTHRAEFCIDKLFSPDSERGRLGLLELRGFEMPPHPEMSLAQALLVRALVARFWREPYRAPLVRWGTRLHDRFLLPAFVAADLADVISDLNSHGIAFELDWLEPFVEFRFPRLAHQAVHGLTLELRAAIEPWHVLGEEATGSGTARYVDSSIERLQVSVLGAVEGRHRLTCNGFPVPLHTVNGSDALVAGVRFRAWAPPSALHPTIGIHSPLVFELIDGWSGARLGGLTYHVAHPGGRAYDTPPVNASEAEARRAARVTPGGHVDPPEGRAAPPVSSAEYPVTVDLRTLSAGHGAVGQAGR